MSAIDPTIENALAAAAEVYGKPLSEAALRVYAAALSDLTPREIEAGVMRHLRDPKHGGFMPKPADILRQVRGDGPADGRPDADEAFAMVPKSELETAVWTQEMAQAWFRGACDLYPTDRVGARMAFRAAYERVVEAARSQREPVRWSVSLGHDPQGREAPLRLAVERGLLPASAVAGLLPPPADSASEVGRQVLAQLSVARPARAAA